MATPAWIERLVEEHQQLTTKMVMLGQFMNSEEGLALDANQRALMLVQSHGMGLYNTAVEGRLQLIGCYPATGAVLVIPPPEKAEL